MSEEEQVSNNETDQFKNNVHIDDDMKKRMDEYRQRQESLSQNNHTGETIPDAIDAPFGYHDKNFNVDFDIYHVEKIDISNNDGKIDFISKILAAQHNKFEAISEALDNDYSGTADDRQNCLKGDVQTHIRT